jgi:hypothetical protein
MRERATARSITDSKVAQNLGVSKLPNPGPGDVVYPDFVVPRSKGGYSAVTSKSRVFAEGISQAELERVVMGDLREGLEKYYGNRYVRRRGLDLTGEPIRIDELILNYTPPVPGAIRARITTIGAAYEGVDVKIGLLDSRAR